MLDGIEVIERLWQAALPDTAEELAPFDVLVTMGPKPSLLPDGLQWRHFGFMDPGFDSDFGAKPRYLALSAAAYAAGEHRRGKRVLVTCTQGLNRSGYVVAVVLCDLLGVTGVEAIRMVKRRRAGALYNPVLTEVLETVRA